MKTKTYFLIHKLVQHSSLKGVPYTQKHTHRRQIMVNNASLALAGRGSGKSGGKEKNQIELWSSGNPMKMALLYVDLGAYESIIIIHSS